MTVPNPPRPRSSRTCPACGSTDRIPIVYGLPTPEAFAQADRGEIALGGCLVDQRNPRWHCRRCGTSWGPAGIHEDEEEDEAPS